ncbi:MAG: hypothetical protein OQK32_00855 [Gammaproteobacteria bacterium]|nr:hypothetical protein [Gammaproteobacteria bacterium]MCW8923233.1 hypothetical protein [Gammaproteobacteria bacterium]
MDNSKDVDQEAASRFWDNYINILIDQGVKETARRWYVRRVEQYIRHYADERLRTHTAQYVVDFFTEIGREGRLSDWHNGRQSMLYGFFFAACFKKVLRTK